MSNLRDIVRKSQEEQALRNYLKTKYNTTSQADKNRFLKTKEVSTAIDQEVDSILNAFVEEIQKGSPEKKRRRNLAILNLFVTIVTAPGIGYAVNIENWVVVTLLSLVLLGVQLYLIFGE